MFYLREAIIADSSIVDINRQLGSANNTPKATNKNDHNNIFPLLTGGCSEGLDAFRFFFLDTSFKECDLREV